MPGHFYISMAKFYAKNIGAKAQAKEQNPAGGQAVSQAGTTGSLLDQHHHFVLMDDVQVAAQQFTRQILIGIGRIKQGDTVLENIALLLDLLQLLPALIEHSQIFTPREQPGGPSHGKTTHKQQGPKCERLHAALPRKFQM